MNVYRYTSNDRIIFLSGFFPYNLCINWLFFGKRYLVEWPLLWQATLITGSGIVLVYWLVSLFARRLRRQLQGPGSAVQRGWRLIMFSMGMNLVLLLLIMYLYTRLPHLAYQYVAVRFFLAMLASVMLNTITVIMYERSYVVEQWREIMQETEQLNRKSLHHKLHKLKDQVNPHFMFNCLNSLSSLISEDAGKAGRFVDEMGLVYRYMLSNNQQTLSSLADELRFIQAYYHLLKTRYGAGIDMQVQVSSDRLDSRIPTLTLQLLVENAIKHNMVRKEAPLIICIESTSADSLTVTNNLQPRLVKPPSNKVGLTNIDQKYRLLNCPGITVHTSAGRFAITVHLIKTHHDLV